MSLDDALFLVDRGGTNYHSKGSDIGDRIQVGDKVLVQRNDQRFYTWYGKPSDSETPYATRRIRFNNQCYDDGNGGTTAHTDQPGEANLSYWYNCGGPSPLKEWRNIRNKNAASFVDLDGEDFNLLNQSLISEGSVCRITSDAGWRSWHEIQFKGGNDQIGFKPQYTNDDGRERTDLKVEGVTNNYKPANGEILTFDFFDPAGINVFPDIEADDLLLAWDGTANRRVTGQNFKGLFVKPKPPVTESEGFGIWPDRSAYYYGSNIKAMFTGMLPGYTLEDYLKYYKTTAKHGPSSAIYLNTYEENLDGYYGAYAAYWKYEKVGAQYNYQNVRLLMDFEDRETGEVVEHSMTVALMPRTQEEPEA